MKRITKYILFNAGIAVCVYGALIEQAWARPLLWLVLSYQALFSTLFCCVPKCKELALKYGRSVPKEIDFVLSITLVIVLTGWVSVGMGILALWALITTTALFTKPEEIA